MANKKIVHQGAGGMTLVAGLDWQLLPASKKTDAAVREKAKIKSATHFVTAKSQLSEEIQVGKKTKKVFRVTAGLAQSLGSDGFGKKPHSAAAAFAAWTKECNKSALYAVVDDDRVVVAVVINGMPVLDSIVSDRAEARMRLAGFLSDHPDMQVFANEIDQYPNDYYEDLWEAIASSISGATALKSIPIDILKIAVVLIVLAAAVGGWQFWQAEQKRRAQAALAAEAAKKNPEALYLKSLSSVTSFGIERQSMLDAFESVMPMPYSVNGWHTREALCADGALACSLVMERTHGTFEMLSQGIAHLPLKAQPNVKEITLTRVSMNWEPGLKPLPALPDASRNATVETFISKDGSQFQEWMLAGLSLRIDPPALYPETPGVPPNFSHPQAVRRGAFEVGGVPLPLVPELIRTAPANVVFTGYKITLSGDGDDPLSKANTTISGFYYVNQ